MRVDRRFNATCGAINKLDVQRVLEIGDHLRHGRLRHPELCGRLGEAARLNDFEQHAQVAQAQPTSDPIVPVSDFRHKGWLWSMQLIAWFRLYLCFRMVATD